MTRSTIITGLITTLCTASNAFAATGARHDNSGIFVWIFLGFCALIVVAQTMPALFMLAGAIKALGKERTPATQSATANVPHGPDPGLK